MSRSNSHTITTGLEVTMPITRPQDFDDATVAAEQLADLEEADESADEASDADGRVAMEPGEESDDTESGSAGADARPRRFAKVRAVRWKSLFAYSVLPLIVMLLALAAGYLRWHDGSERQTQLAAEQSTRAAAESTSAMLSYKPETVEQDLVAASGRLTGSFKSEYMSLIHDVVIPGARQKHISAVATVPAAASVAATDNHAVVLVFVDQTTIIGNDAPSSTASSVRVTLDKAGDKWLISKFDPL